MSKFLKVMRSAITLYESIATHDKKFLTEFKEVCNNYCERHNDEEFARELLISLLKLDYTQVESNSATYYVTNILAHVCHIIIEKKLTLETLAIINVFIDGFKEKVFGSSKKANYFLNKIKFIFDTHLEANSNPPKLTSQDFSDDDFPDLLNHEQQAIAANAVLMQTIQNQRTELDRLLNSYRKLKKHIDFLETHDAELSLAVSSQQEVINQLTDENVNLKTLFSNTLAQFSGIHGLTIEIPESKDQVPDLARLVRNRELVFKAIQDQRRDEAKQVPFPFTTMRRKM